MLERENRELREKLKLRNRIITVTAIVLILLFVFYLIVDDISWGNRMEIEIEMIARSREWHQVTDGSVKRGIIQSLKEQEVIDEDGKDKAVLIMLNGERTLGTAVFFGSMNSRTFVTYDYDKNRNEAILRYAKHE